MEQLTPSKAGLPPHVHDQGEEVSYILDGELARQLGGQVTAATRGHLVRSRPAPPRLRRLRDWPAAHLHVTGREDNPNGA